MEPRQERPRHSLSERRRFRRQQMELWAESNDGLSVSFHLTKDLSEGGTFLATECPLEAGTALELRLEVPGRNGGMERMALRGMVVQQGPRSRPGMGVRFFGLTVNDLHRLRQILEG